MLRWNHKFEKENKRKFLEYIEPFNDKLIFVKATKR